MQARQTDLWGNPVAEGTYVAEAVKPPEPVKVIVTGYWTPKREKREKRDPKVNPMLAVYGPGPEGLTCKGCVHLRYVQMAGRYYKCDLRKLTHGAATDHRVRWPACGRYERREYGK